MLSMECPRIEEVMRAGRRRHRFDNSDKTIYQDRNGPIIENELGQNIAGDHYSIISLCSVSFRACIRHLPYHWICSIIKLGCSYGLNVELRLEERSAYCNMFIRQTYWSNASQAIEALEKEIAEKLTPYNLSFNILSWEFVSSMNFSTTVDFVITNLPADGGPLKYGYNDYSFKLDWLADWAGAPLTQWTQEASSYNQGVISYLKEVEGKTYRFTVDPYVSIQGFTEIANCTGTQITYSVFVPNTILDLQILQNGIKVVNITNFLDRGEFNQIYSQGEQYRSKVLKDASEELAVKLTPFGLTATDFEVYLSEPYSALGVHYIVRGAVDKVNNSRYRVNLKFLDIPLSEFTISQTSDSTVLRYILGI